MERKKTSKKAKVTKPAEDPKVTELEQQIPASDTFIAQPEEPAPDIPPEIPDPSIDQTNNNPLNTKSSSPIKLAETHADHVMITGTSFKEPGRPTFLAKHSAKEEHIEKRKVRFDIDNSAANTCEYSLAPLVSNQ